MNIKGRLKTLEKTFGVSSSLNITDNGDYLRVTVSAYGDAVMYNASSSVLKSSYETIGDSLLDEAIDYCIYRLAGYIYGSESKAG